MQFQEAALATQRMTTILRATALATPDNRIATRAEMALLATQTRLATQTQTLTETLATRGNKTVSLRTNLPEGE